METPARNHGRGGGLGFRVRDAMRASRGTEPPSEEPIDSQVSLDQAIEVLAAADVEDVQQRGYHFQKRDFYSALNDLPFLRENQDLWHGQGLPQGMDWDLDAQVGRVRQMAPYVKELADVPFEPPPGPPAYHWENDFWRAGDAFVHYCLLRSAKPRRVVEVGCGWSSLLMARALGRNQAEGGEPTAVEQIEPYPRRELLSALPEHWQLHDVILQRADLRVFEALEDGDICFYDGSHVTRPGSDVNFFFFEVLPRLKPGVLIHIHDIFWPHHYPDSWIFERGQTWNEQYVLQAFLMYNRGFELLICNSALFHYRKSELAEIYGVLPEPHHNGGSVWLRRREGPA